MTSPVASTPETTGPESFGPPNLGKLIGQKATAEPAGGLGHEHQSLPVLILAEGTDDAHATGRARGRSFTNEEDAILAALATRHGIPIPHP